MSVREPASMPRVLGGAPAAGRRRYPRRAWRWRARCSAIRRSRSARRRLGSAWPHPHSIAICPAAEARSQSWAGEPGEPRSADPALGSGVSSLTAAMPGGSRAARSPGSASGQERSSSAPTRLKASRSCPADRSSSASSSGSGDAEDWPRTGRNPASAEVWINSAHSRLTTRHLAKYCYV